MHRSSANLSLDPGSVVVPSRGALYVFNRKGLTTIEASHIDEIHERVKKYLDGNYTEAELMTAVPAEKQPVLRKYFDAMSQAGALHSGLRDEQGLQLSVEEASADGCNLILKTAGKTTWVSLAGPCLAAGGAWDACLLFVSPAEMEDEWKRIWRVGRPGAHRICVVTEKKSAEHLHQTELDKRKRYAAWLVCALRMDFWESSALRIYKFDQENPALGHSFSADMNLKKAGFELVAPTEHSQIPLVIAKAEVPFCSQIITGCGLDYSQLAEELEQEFITKAVISSRGETTYITESKNWDNPKTLLRRVKISDQRALAWPVADSLLDLRLRGLEQFCYELSQAQFSGDSSEADLLQLGAKHPQIAYLASLLQVRIPALPATLGTTQYGLHVCRAGMHTAYSLVEAKAIRDVLLRIVKDQFYGDSAANIAIRHECDFGIFLNQDELGALVLRQNDLLDKNKISRKYIFKHVRRLGISAWTGTISHGN